MGTIFFKVLEMSIAALLLIAVVSIIRIPLRRAPKWFMGVLWTIVALRLLVPVQITAHVGFMPDFGNIVNACFDGENDTETAEGPVSVNGGIYETVGYTKTITGVETADAAENSKEAATTHSSIAAEETTEASALPIILHVIWLIGVALLLGYGAFNYIKIKRKVAASIRYIEGDNIYVCDDIDTPFIFGTIKPAIYMPSGLSSKIITNVIAHERAHLQRFDHIRKQLGFLILAIHWFNPMVWLAYALFCRDIELACDERVVKRMTLSQKKSYANSLLSCSTQRRMVFAYPLAFGEVGVGTRVKQIFNYKKPTAWLVTALIIISVVLSTSSFTKAADKKPEKVEKIPLIELEDVEVDVSDNKVSTKVNSNLVPKTDVTVSTDIEGITVNGKSLYEQENGTTKAKESKGAENLPYSSNTDRTAVKIPGNKGDSAYVEVKDGNEEVTVQVTGDNAKVTVKDGKDKVSVDTSNPVVKEGESIVGDVLDQVDEIIQDENVGQIVDEAIDEVYDEVIDEVYDDVIDEVYDEVFDEIIDEGLGGLFKLFP